MDLTEQHSTWRWTSPVLNPERHSRNAVLLMAAWLTLASPPICAQVSYHVIPAGEPPIPGNSLPGDALADTHVGRGKNDIVQAWLAQPTRRYPHGVLGDTVEATAVRVRTRDGSVLSYVLPEDSVFEDLLPRVYDINRDGLDEIILVRSRQQSGASLISLGIRDGKLVSLAESEPMGNRNQWMNPIGVADVDGDGNLELLVVLSPHENGMLIEYKFDGLSIVPGHRISGVTNHIAGTRAQGMAALMDANGDGIPDVLIPSADRRSLRAITFSFGVPMEFARFSLPAPAAGNFENTQPRTLLIPLEDGRRVRIEWRGKE